MCVIGRSAVAARTKSTVVRILYAAVQRTAVYCIAVKSALWLLLLLLLVM